VGLDARLDGHARIDEELTRALLPDYASKVAPMMIEIHDAVQRIDEALIDPLLDLAQGSTHLGGSVSPESVRQLRQLGVITVDGGEYRIAIGSFSNWLVHNLARSAAVASA